jgi:signal transduction histidine kinase
VSQSLDLREILGSALEIVLDLVKLDAGWVVLREPDSEGLSPVTSRGLPEGIAPAQTECPCGRCVCAAALEEGYPFIFQEVSEQPCEGAEDACQLAEYLREKGLVVRACVPLKSKDRVLGVMILTGRDFGDLLGLSGNSSELLTAVGRQIGIAVENAKLYEELKQNETVRRQLLERLIIVQEDERKRIARELHDQTGQRLTSLIMALKVLGEANSLSEVRSRLQDLRGAAAEIMEDAHDLALELRPSVLDDLGLVAALRQYLRGYRDRFRVPADFQAVGIMSERLPPDVEMALYRIAQEALSNVARHADARGVSVLLENRGDSVVLIVEDNGKGFDVSQVMGSRAHAQNLGLYGMRERASLIGGTLTIESTPGVGTTVFVETPLRRENGEHAEDPVVGSR